MHRIKNAKIALLVAVMTTMVGCADRVSLAEDEMQKIRQQQPQPIQQPPQPQPIEDFAYAASNIRDPFFPQSLLELQAKVADAPTIKPDEERPKEELESYELTELVYKGKVVAPNGQEYGLVLAPDGLVRDVQIGNYMGKNHGRIVEITPTQINMIEIVEDTRLGYVEKSANLISPN